MDMSKLGFTFPIVTMLVERGKIREFARATFDDREIYRDEMAAANEGFKNIPAPPTFSTTEALWSDVNRASELGIDISRTLKGGSEWEYLTPVVAGDTLTRHERVADISSKQGRNGTMTIVTTETEFVNQEGEVVLRVRENLIELDRMPS